MLRFFFFFWSPCCLLYCDGQRARVRTSPIGDLDWGFCETGLDWLVICNELQAICPVIVVRLVKVNHHIQFLRCDRYQAGLGFEKGQM